jgi:2'-5' RNA ligase
MSTESESWKLFVAGALPPDLTEALSGLQAKLKRGLGARGVELRWTKPENLHFTLFFLGRTPVTRLQEIQTALEVAADGGSPLPVEVHGTGAFPDERSARVLWAGVKNSRELRALQARVERALTPLGFPAEGREFHPHVTLARFKDARSLREYVDLYRRHVFGHFPLTEIVLYRSHPAVPFPRYEAIARFPLRGGTFSISLSEEKR